MKLRLLNKEDSRRIFQSALEILRSVGMHVADEDTRKLLKRAGSKENEEGRILFKEDLVRNTISSVPGKLVLFDRSGRPAVDTSDTVPRFSPGLNCIYVLDYTTGEHRLCSLNDITETARVCDRLHNIDLVAGLGNPSDIPAREQPLETVKAMVRETGKPLAFIAHNEVEGEEIWNYLVDVAGGWEAFSAKPFALDLTGPYSPLELGEEACRRLRFAARNRLPVVCYPALLTGAAGPVTLAGALAQSSAEILGGITVHQLEQPGAPVISGSSILPMDLLSGNIAYGSPEYTLACLGAVDVFSDLGVPSWFGAGCSDAHTVDIQAASEAGMSIQTAALSGTSFIHNLGYLSAGKTGSLEMLVLCDELAGMARRCASGITVDDETLAVDITKRAYKDRTFLMDEHTLKHMRTALRNSRLFERTAIVEKKPNPGSETLKKRIREKLLDLVRQKG